jgi:hypothetical protein
MTELQFIPGIERDPCSKDRAVILLEAPESHFILRLVDHGPDRTRIQG